MSKAMQIFATGVTITTGATSASASIPNCANGTKPKYIRVASTASAYVKIGTTAVAGDVLVQPGDSIVLAVAGASTIAAIQVSAAGTVQVSPLEDC
jgi:1-aminocyclopropane-1-carboxylate deaminase/D-cysteine desulfhydrase-like pyridoxal-dependent ACC family enzyme